MADEKEPKAGEDPWAGLESEQLPDLNAGFDFSFDDATEEPGAVEQADAPPSADLSAPSSEADDSDEAAGSDAIEEWLEEPEAGTTAPELSVFQSDDEDASHAGESWQVAASEPSAVVPPSEPPAIDAASNEDAVADLFEPESESGDDTDDAVGNTGGMFSFTESVEPQAHEGPSESGAAEAVESNDFDFAGISAGDDAAADGEREEVAEATEDDGSPFGEPVSLEAPAVAATAADESKAAEAKPSKPKRVAPAKKKKPSMVGQMIGMVGGGAMSIPIVLGILWWGVGKDPLKVAPMVPDSLGFLVPAKLRPGFVATSAGGGSAPSLDDVLGGSGGELPDVPDVAVVEPESLNEIEPVVPDPDPVVADDSTVANVDGPTDSQSEGDDELMALLNEETSAPAQPTPPPAVPEPEPLDIAALQTATDAAIAALAAVEGVDDPSDPVHKKLLVECYKALATYAQELAILERVAADTGRPLDTMPAPVTALHDVLSGRPELFDALARLTRDWLAYSKRSSDGVVAPVAFVSARRVGPYWRAEVMVGERPLVVLTRSEPAAAQGDILLVTGLSVDKDVVWATDVRPAKAGDPFGL